MTNSKPTELRIKLAHIGMEPSIIRKHERRIKNRIQYWKDKRLNNDDEVILSYSELHSLQHHRRWDVRNEARATHLALGFLSGKSYKVMENKACIHVRRCYIQPKIVEMVLKYGHTTFSREEITEQVKDWFKT